MQQPQQNPYASPMSQAPPPIQHQQKGYVEPAGQGLRFANMLIDSAVQFGIGFVAGFAIVAMAGNDGLIFLEGIGGNLIGIPIGLAYYFLMEVTTGRTLGKLVTGTKVVNEHGEPASTGQILGRTFSRFIPFEAFSFLGTPCRGWHDSLPNTYVIKA